MKPHIKKIKANRNFWDAHGLTPTNLIKNFKVLMKCRSKLDCLIYEMLWIKNKGLKLNTQTDSIRAKLFTWMLSCQFIFSFSKSIIKYAFPLL